VPREKRRRIVCPLQGQKTIPEKSEDYEALTYRHIKKLSKILLTEKSVEQHPKPVYENLVAKKPLSSKPGKLLVLLQILNPNVHQTCRTIHQMPKSGKLSIQ
jgi:hypothetical protein